MKPLQIDRLLVTKSSTESKEVMLQIFGDSGPGEHIYLSQNCVAKLICYLQYLQMSADYKENVVLPPIPEADTKPKKILSFPKKIIKKLSKKNINKNSAVVDNVVDLNEFKNRKLLRAK